MRGTMDIIRDGLEELGLTGQASPCAAQELDRYGQRLLEKNQVMNLTAIREAEAVARLHMLDCAALLNAPGADFAGKTLIDVGTGAGFPGMALKILVPSLDVTLLDSLNKRLEWLLELCGELSLRGVRTVHARAEEQARLPDYRERFDFAAARAVADMRALCELCLPYVKVGGLFLAMKGVNCQEELERAAPAAEKLGGRIENVWDYAVPGTDVRHRVVMVRKIAPTPAGYPRSWAKIQKHAL